MLLIRLLGRLGAGEKRKEDAKPLLFPGVSGNSRGERMGGFSKSKQSIIWFRLSFMASILGLSNILGLEIPGLGFPVFLSPSSKGEDLLKSRGDRNIAVLRGDASFGGTGVELFWKKEFSGKVLQD